MTTPGAIGYIEYGYALSQKLPDGDSREQIGRLRRGLDRIRQAGLASAHLPDD